jgi:gluconate:H+ symporter, GntP family
MTGHAWFLICVLVVSIVVLIALINSRMKFHPFAALIVVALAAGVATGMSAADIASSIEDGAGGILGDVGLTLAFGTMLGRLMADSGAVEQIATVLVDRSSTRALPLMMTIAAFVIGIPMFFEVGLIVLLPLVFSVAEAVRRERPDVRSPYVILVIPTVAALATLHGMLPPHPGPLVAVDGLNADLGKTIIVGLVCAIPTVLLAGPVFARFMSSRVTLEPDAEIVAQFTHPVAARSASIPSGAMSAGTDANPSRSTRAEVPTAMALCAVGVPVALMLFRTIAEIACAKDDPVLGVATLVGTPVVAMLLGFLFALFFIAYRQGRTGDEIRQSVSDSLKPIVGILMIIGGGGAFNGVLKNSGIGDAVAAAASHLHIGTIFLGWLLALLLSASTGSATVGIVSSTGIIAPLVAAQGPWYVSLVVIAIGAGSMGLNYVNHAGFWLVKESFGMTMGQAVRINTLVMTLVSVIALAMVLLVSIFV